MNLRCEGWAGEGWEQAVWEEADGNPVSTQNQTGHRGEKTAVVMLEGTTCPE